MCIELKWSTGDERERNGGWIWEYEQINSLWLCRESLRSTWTHGQVLTTLLMAMISNRRKSREVSVWQTKLVATVQQRRDQRPGRTEKVWARWRRRGRGDGRLPRMGKPGPCQQLSPYSARIQSCGPSPGPLACLPVPPPGLPLRPSGSLGLKIFWIRFASPGLSTVEPPREAVFSILVPGPWLCICPAARVLAGPCPSPMQGTGWKVEI